MNAALTAEQAYREFLDWLKEYPKPKHSEVVSGASGPLSAPRDGDSREPSPIVPPPDFLSVQPWS